MVQWRMTGESIMKQIECNGKCNCLHTCKGKLYRVNVASHGKDWGEYWSCETAIKQDERNNFHVTVLGEYIAR